MKKFLFLVVALSVAAIATASTAQAQVPLISIERLSVSGGVDQFYIYSDIDSPTDRVDNGWQATIASAYTLPFRFPAALTLKASKPFDSSPVRLELGARVLLFRGGQFLPVSE